MATSRTLLAEDNSTLANFKAWAMWLSGFLNTCGWVQTADTGQVNWGSIAAVPAINTYVYEIWRMNDAMQATMPVFLKIEYGTGTVATYPALRINIGTSTNGAGTLINACTALAMVCTATGGANLYDCVASGDSGRIQFYIFRTVASAINCCIVSIERSVDSSGTPNADFAYMQMCTGTAAPKGQWLSSTTSGPQRTAQEGHNNTDAVTQMSGYVAVFPCRPVVGYERNPLLGLFRGALSDWYDGDLVTITMYPGQPHTYLVPKTGAVAIYYGAGGTNNTLIMRWE